MPTSTNPFGSLAKKYKRTGIASTLPTTATTAAARAAAIARQNDIMPAGPSLSPAQAQQQVASQLAGASGANAAYGLGGAFTGNKIGSPSLPSTTQQAVRNAAYGPSGGATAATQAANQVVQGVGAPMSQLAAAAASGGNPAFPTGSGYQAQTQLGKAYRDLMLPTAWDDPEALIDTFYRTYGYDKGSGDYGMMLENADNLGILYMALMGEGAFQGNANFVDWAANYMQEQRQPGDGRSLAPGEIWNALINPGSNTPLNYYLNNPTLTPEDQVNNFMSSMRYGMETTLPAPILNALMAQVDQMGREFRSLRNTQAGSASFTEYLNSRPNSLPAGF